MINKIKKQLSEYKKVEESSSSVDMVNSPPHYVSGGIETIDFIKAKLSYKEYLGYLRGNIIKYWSRVGLKGSSLKDVKKAQYYTNEYVSTVEQVEEQRRKGNAEKTNNSSR